MGLPKNILELYSYLEEDSILIGYRGSIAHGMYIPNSQPDSIDDKDVMAICIPSIEYYYGLREFGSRGTKEIKHNEWDIVTYELRKFVRLLAKGNPNVLCMLWLSPTDYIKKTVESSLIIQNKQLFASKAVYHSFTGYAHGQLHRMTHHTYRGYMGEKRKRLVEKHGYDTKNAAHLIRLLRMGIEFLNEGELHVKREDSQQLLDIKRGEWTLEKVQSEADRLFKRAEAAYDNSTLPAKPNMDEINKLCVNILKIHFGQ